MASVPQPQDESAFPAYWDWAADGAAEGTFLRMEEGPTAFGRRPIIILEIGGVERSIWINAEAIRNKLADELERRKARDFTPGERVEIRRGAEKKTSAADRQYWPFRVDFPDAPKSDAAGLLGLDSDDDNDDDEPLPPAAKLDDDLPF
jgi:hypothetical protein